MYHHQLEQSVKNIMRKTPVATFVALVIGTIGDVGQLLLLRHELIDCYPFKMLAYPPAQFYEQLGSIRNVAVLGVTTVLLAMIIARKAPLRIPPVATVLAPLLYLVVVVTATSARYGWTVPTGIRNFDGYSVGEATAEFAGISVELAVGGLIIGGICSRVLQRTTRQKHAAVS